MCLHKRARPVYHTVIFFSQPPEHQKQTIRKIYVSNENFMTEEFGLTLTTRTHVPGTSPAISPSELADSTGGMFCIQWLEKSCVTDKIVQTKTLSFQPRPRKALDVFPIKSGGLTSLSLSSASATLFPIYLYISIIVKHMTAKLFHKPWLFVIQTTRRSTTEPYPAKHNAYSLLRHC